MCIPLQIQIVSGNDLISLLLAGMLFTPETSGYPYGYLMPAIGQPFGVSTILFNLGIGLFLAFPAIAFNYRLVKSPMNKPFRNLAIGTLVISSFIIFMAMIMVMPLFSSMYFYNYLLMQNIQTFPTMVIGAFLILPMIQRQAVFIATPEVMHSHPIRAVERDSELRVGREKILATFLWMGLFFLPFFMTSTNDYYYSSSVVLSFAYQFNFGYYDTFIVESGFPALIGYAVPFFSLIPFGVLSGLQFVYIRDIYRYLKHEIKFQRIVFMGILAAIFPVIGFFMLAALISPWSIAMTTIIPIPCLLILGLVIAKLHRSVLPSAGRVWEDVDARMWFEQKVIAQPVKTVPEKPYRPAEETIKVPLAYMVVSQIRKKRHNGRSQEQDSEEQPW
jgi:hypothetical protein